MKKILFVIALGAFAACNNAAKEEAPAAEGEAAAEAPAEN